MRLTISSTLVASWLILLVVYSLAERVQRFPAADDDEEEEETSPGRNHPKVSSFLQGLVVIRAIQNLQSQQSSAIISDNPLNFRDHPAAALSRRRMAFAARTPTGGGAEMANPESIEPHDGMVLQIIEEGSLQQQYELQEVVHTELGIAAKHAADFAFTPVETMPDETTRNQDTGLVEEPIHQDWWSWWLSNEEWKVDAGTYHMNSRAFAGGSHGEVWRGQRRCTDPAESEFCGKQLVFKRLKVVKGYRVLEAGLREVYFGRWLGQLERAKQRDSQMFTRYADHFFREQSGQLELWIVFEDAGSSLRSYLYTGSLVGDHVVYQQSLLWQQMRLSVSNTGGTQNTKQRDDQSSGDQGEPEGRSLMRVILEQALSAAAFLHEKGVVLRDIKPSNILCTSIEQLLMEGRLTAAFDASSFTCVLADFSSAWDSFVGENLYTRGPSRAEQTDEYAPPEAFFGTYNETILQPAFDSWSIGVLALELLLGTPNVFSVDQRTRVVLTQKMRRQGASESDISRALYLAALSQFCIYSPNRQGGHAHGKQGWPLRRGDPLHQSNMVKNENTCTIVDFHMALLARDPLGVGFESSADLLHLIWRLLEFNPEERISASEALQHPYFVGGSVSQTNIHAVESQMLDPRLDFNATAVVSEFHCPKCARTFSDWRSCQYHARARNHSKFCDYDKTALPKCISSHDLLPAHSASGYCDIQGRRKVIEDFHTIHLFPTHQFYGIFDGHLGNFASKFATSSLYDQIVTKDVLSFHPGMADWKEQYTTAFQDAFQKVHQNFLKAVHLLAHGAMDQSGTTATVMFVSDVFVFANLGDSRAIISTAQGPTISFHQLTQDHVAGDAEEQRSVRKRGGRILQSGGIDRVNGTLAVTRSIGDADLQNVLSQVPDVFVYTRTEIQEFCGTLPVCFVVIASDGLWDVMSNQEVIEMVLWTGEGSKSTMDFQGAAEALVHEAYVRGSTDNIGVCIVQI